MLNLIGWFCCLKFNNFFRKLNEIYPSYPVQKRTQSMKIIKAKLKHYGFTNSILLIEIFKLLKLLPISLIKYRKAWEN